MSAPVNEKAVYTLNPPAGAQMSEAQAPGYTPQSPPAGYSGSSPSGYPASPGAPAGYPAGAPAANIGAQYQNERKRPDVHCGFVVELISSSFARTVLARCARGQHDATRKYGMCGIITAIVCFPCGLICLLYVSLCPAPVVSI